MTLERADWAALEEISRTEAESYAAFLHGHPIQTIRIKERDVAFCLSGKGEPAVLIFAGGWGGPELSYETILALEDGHRVIVIDTDSISRPSELAEVADGLMDRLGIDRIALVGQSLAGILGQVYFRRRPERVAGMVLALTPAPHKKNARRWALALIQVLPLSLFRVLLARSLKRLSRTTKPIPEDVSERLAFKGTFTARMFRSYATRRKLTGVLKLAFALSAAGDYTPEELGSWPGKLLVITSPDDPYHRDIAVFSDAFPRTEIVKLPEGYGHIAPQVFREEFFTAIRDFLGSLRAPT
jgi:pimeloyl-ACP methyl ester carboxylesterase